MILPDFILHSRVNARWDYSGIDSIENCLDKTHFKNYPYKVEYSHNSRGFRDAEWPDSVEELKNAIWCIGDSFTVGVGSPLAHTWPYLLQQQTGRRCINVSMDGASNEWIARKTQSIINEVAPANIVIMWSYTNRREHKDILLSDERRRLSLVNASHLDDFLNFKSCISAVIGPEIRHMLIPRAHHGDDIQLLIKIYNDVKDASWPSITSLKDFVKLPPSIVNELDIVYNVYDRLLELSEVDYCKSVHNLLEVEQLDYARDYHHFDLVTAKWLVEQICRYN